MGGKQYALPFDYPNRSLFANLTAFQEAGLQPPPITYKDDTWTWDAFRTSMDSLQRRFGPGGAFAVDVWRDAVRSWIAWVWNNGGDFLSTDQQRRDSLSVYGNRVMRPPAADRLYGFVYGAIDSL